MNALEGIELVEEGAHKRLRGRKLIKEEGALILQHSDHLTNKLTFVCSAACESTHYLATSLSQGRFNIYFGGLSMPALGRLFHKSCKEFQHRHTFHLATQRRRLCTF